MSQTRKTRKTNPHELSSFVQIFEEKRSLYMMNRLNLSFYSHINIHSSIHTSVVENGIKDVLLMCENQ